MDAQTHRPIANPSTRTAGYRPDIDGLRAVAVTAVVLFHAGIAALPGGFVGVDVFFVISGFLIGGIVDRDVGAGRFTFTGFYLRRARRILPALFAVAAATSVLGLVLLAHEELTRLAVGIGAALAGVSNIWFWASGGYFTPDARLEPFLMTWSLGVEEQFYLALPPLLLLVHRRWPRRVPLVIAVLTLASLAGSLILTASTPTAAFYLLPARAWELGIGVLLALISVEPKRLAADAIALAGAAALILAIMTLGEHTPFPGYAALLPTLGTAMLIVARHSLINRHLLGAKPVVAVGLISYSWYLWHWPLMALVRVASPRAPGSAPLLVAALASLALAWASWRYVEQPFRVPGRLSAGRALSGYAAALGIALAAAVAVYAAHGLPRRLPDAASRVASLRTEARRAPCLASYGVDTPRVAACTSVGGSPRIAILGDSHAAALALGLADAAARHGQGLVQLTKASCPPLSGGTRAMPGHPGHAEQCRRFNAAAIAAVAADPGIATVIVTAFWQVPFDPSAIAGGDRYLGSDPALDSEAALVAGIRATASALVRSGKRVVVLGDGPGFRFDPARFGYAAYLPVRAAVGRWADPDFAAGNGSVDRRFVAPLGDQGDRAVHTAVAGLGHVQGASLADVFCDARRCRYTDGATPWFTDPQHLSSAGARHALAVLDPLLWPR